MSGAFRKYTELLNSAPRTPLMSSCLAGRRLELVQVLIYEEMTGLQLGQCRLE